MLADEPPPLPGPSLSETEEDDDHRTHLDISIDEEVPSMSLPPLDLPQHSPVAAPLKEPLREVEHVRGEEMHNGHAENGVVENGVDEEDDCADVSTASFIPIPSDADASTCPEETSQAGDENEAVAEDDDDFGDFTDFADAAPVSTASAFGDWGAFDRADAGKERGEKEEDEWNAFGEPVAAAKADPGDDWADESHAAPASRSQTQLHSVEFDEGDEWGDAAFASAAPSAQPVQHAQPAAPKEAHLSLEELSRDEGIWDLFDGEEEQEEQEEHVQEVLHLTHHLDEKELPAEMQEAHENEILAWRVWRCLCVVEEARALLFSWRHSAANAASMKHLGIDPKAVVSSKKCLPALSTGVLRPTPVSNGGGRIVSIATSGDRVTAVTRRSSEDDDPPTKATPTLSATPVTTTADANSGVDLSSLPPPPSAMIDCDFFSTPSSSSTSTAPSAMDSLHNDLAKFGLSGGGALVGGVAGVGALSATGASGQGPSSTAGVLDGVLLSSSCSVISRPVGELSLDAKALHDQLPDIDFLKANMIMFPIGGSRRD